MTLMLYLNKNKKNSKILITSVENKKKVMNVQTKNDRKISKAIAEGTWSQEYFCISVPTFFFTVKTYHESNQVFFVHLFWLHLKT